MKILKYLLLLLLLFSFALTVFVFTKDGRYTFEESMSINLDSSLVMPFIKDHEKWQYWFDFNQSFDKIKTSKSSFVWVNSSKKLVKEDLKDSIQYTFTFDDLKNVTFIKIDKKSHLTKVIWRCQGEMTFKEKFLYYLPFSSTTNFQSIIKESLNQLKIYLTERYLNHEITFGEVENFASTDLFVFPFQANADSLTHQYYVFKSKSDSILTARSLKKLQEQFIIYNDTFNKKALADYGLATTIQKDSIFYESKTKLFVTKPFQRIKVTLKGNYVFKKDVLTKLAKHLVEIKYTRSTIGFITEKPIKNAKDNLPENEWITHFYFPVKPQLENTKALNINPQNQQKPRKTAQPTAAPAPAREVIKPVEQIDIKEKESEILEKTN